LSQKLTQFQKTNPSNEMNGKRVSTLISDVLKSPKVTFKVNKQINQISKFFSTNPQQMGLMNSFLKASVSNSKQLSKLFLILSKIKLAVSSQYFIQYGLKSTIKENVLVALLCAFKWDEENGNMRVLAELVSLAKSNDNLISSFAKNSMKSFLLKHTRLNENHFPILKSKLADDDFPYNRSWSGSVGIGGDEIGAQLAASLFAGTNFDCNHPTFNYEARGEAQFDVSLFGYTAKAVDAVAIYGRANGSPLANQIYLNVFGDIIYDQPIGPIDCLNHGADIAHTSPGFDISYTVWISVIPVTFEASTSLDLDLSYFWQLCPDQLSASLEIVPTATLAFGGSAEIDLLIVKAGIELTGQLKSSIPPKVELDGSMCEVEFEVDLNVDPTEIQFDAYLDIKSCKFWIFDCHWKKEETYTIFSFTEPSQTTVLYQQSWKISP